MSPRRRSPRLLGALLAATLGGAGCSLIVAGDVPEFQCIDTTSSCPTGLHCDEASQRCVAADIIVPPDGPEEDAPVDDDVKEAGGPDVDASGPHLLGAQCRVDVECVSKLCGTSTILTTGITKSTGPICTSPCCTSAECPSSFVCFNGGTGGGYCVPAALAQRTPPTSGGKTGGAACTANTECRSGLCDGAPKTCLDTCCAGADCGGTSTCRLKTVKIPAPSHEVWSCAAPESGATGAPGDDCSGSAPSCASDACIGFGSQICRPSCSNTASCRTIPGFTSGHCLYGYSGNDYFKFCFVGTTAADAPAGAACADPSECQSDYCDAELKKCANVCGKDADCAPNEACRPCGVNTPYLRCVPRP